MEREQKVEEDEAAWLKRNETKLKASDTSPGDLKALKAELNTCEGLIHEIRQKLAKKSPSPISSHLPALLQSAESKRSRLHSTLVNEHPSKTEAIHRRRGHTEMRWWEI
jgi:hypothetical protein